MKKEYRFIVIDYKTKTYNQTNDLDKLDKEIKDKEYFNNLYKRYYPTEELNINKELGIKIMLFLAFWFLFYFALKLFGLTLGILFTLSFMIFMYFYITNKIKHIKNKTK